MLCECVICVCICVYVCVYVCAYVCMCVCVFLSSSEHDSSINYHSLLVHFMGINNLLMNVHFPPPPPQVHDRTHTSLLHLNRKFVCFGHTAMISTGMAFTGGQGQ